MRTEARCWLDRRTYDGCSWSADELVRRKARGINTSVSVVLPARNEERTVGDIVGMLRRELVDRVGLVDEVVVMDSGSEDRTAQVAAEAGARVAACHDVAPGWGSVPGKGEALWKSLFVTSGDLLVFVDADLVDVGPQFVTGLLGPLLCDPSVGFVKALYDRPLTTPAGVAPSGGGRVTELVARPLLNLYWPELAGVVQPLSGEYAARRSVLERLPFVSGYGVEVGMLIDLLPVVGLDGLAQVDLGRRVHRHQSDDALGLMASAIIQTVMRRLPGAPAPRHEVGGGARLTQFRRGADGLQEVTSTVALTERPPVRDVADYRLRRESERENTA